MSLHNVPIGKKAPQEFNAVIEIASGGHNKYEFDEELQVMKLDRVLHSPLFYPVEYGYIPETRAADGDHTDVLVITDSPTFPGCVSVVRPIGIMYMNDSGETDNKVIAVQAKNPHYTQVKNLKDIPEHLLKEIEHFFAEYKTLENKKVKITGWGNRQDALKAITEDRKVYTQKG